MDHLIKVMYLSHEGDDMKGSTYSLLNLINSLSENVKPVVIVPTFGKACVEFEKLGLEYFVVPFEVSYTSKHGIKRFISFVPRYIRSAITNYKATNAITKIALLKNIKIIHSNTAAIDIGPEISKKLAVKHVWHLREFLNEDFALNPLTGWRLFLKKINSANALICISNSILNHYKLTNNAKAHVIQDAIRKSSEIQLNKIKKDYFLFCGYVSPPKGIESAITAFAAVHKKYPHLTLQVAGKIKDGYMKTLTSLINKLGVVGAINFLGFQSNVDNLMANATGLLMCSKNEAQGRVTIEAMFQGCPVIGYAAGGTKEIITDNVNGFLYHDIDELIAKMLYLLEREIVGKIIKQAQDYAVNTYSEEVCGLKVLNLYKETLS